MRKRIFSVLLVMCLCVGLLPVTATAAPADESEHWAANAVNTLNALYGTDVFTINDADNMTEGDVKNVLDAMGHENYADLSENTLLTRSKACAILTDIFKLPVEDADNAAITYLYNQHIMSGKAGGDLDYEGSVTGAEFAVLTYRVLNFVGGSQGSSNQNLQPGTEEYFAWMYLNARKASITAEDYSEDKKIDSDTWNSWIACLKDKNNNASAVVAPDNFNPDFPGDETDIITAAIQIVDECINAGGSKYIFWDVAPDAGYYDGVMYLTDRGIVNGEGCGTFNPFGQLQLQQLAAVLHRAAGNNMSGPEGLEAAKQFATENGYMATPDDWSKTATREDAVAAILKWKGVDISDVNIAILDRFDDAGQISEDAKPYLAYAVSHGLMSGTSETTLSPQGDVNRAQTGVILYRVLTGLDTSKMKDYRDSVEYAKNGGVATFSLLQRAAVNNVLELREDWRLTSDLDLNIPEGQTLTIVGNGNHIYELGGRLLNSGEGEVVFAAKTYLYPSASDSVDGTFVAIGSSDGIVLNESAPYYSNGDNAASAEAETWNAYFDAANNTLNLNELNIAESLLVPGGITINVQGNNTIDTAQTATPGIAWLSDGDVTLSGDGGLTVKSSGEYTVGNKISETEGAGYKGGIIIGGDVKLNIENAKASGSCILIYGQNCGVEIKDNADVTLKNLEENGYCIRVKNNGDIKVADDAKLEGTGVFHIEDENLGENTRGSVIIDSSKPVEIDGNDSGQNITIHAKTVTVKEGAALNIKNTGRAVSHIQGGTNLSVSGTMDVSGIQDAGNALKIDHLEITDTGSLTMKTEDADTDLMIAADFVSVSGTLNVDGGLYAIQTSASANGGVIVDGGSVFIKNVTAGMVVAYSGDVEIKNNSTIEIEASNSGILIHSGTNANGQIKLSDCDLKIMGDKHAFTGTVVATLSASDVFAGETEEAKEKVASPTEETWANKYVEIVPFPDLPGSVSINGTAQVGSTLTAQTSDLPDGLTVTYQWQVSDSAEGEFTDIADATGDSYRLTGNEQGKYVRVVVSPAAGSGYTGTLSATTAQAVASNVYYGGTTTYPPTIESSENGSTTISPSSPTSGQTVTIITSPDEGHEVESVVVTDANGQTVTVTDNGDGTYSFTQPAGSVTITVTYAEDKCDGTEADNCPSIVFDDLNANAWYHEFVDYAIENGLMNGTGDRTFSPELPVTRAQVVTVLWRLENRPTVDYTMTFEDVAEGQWYTEAIRWADSINVVSGYSAEEYGTDDYITRQDMATVIYRYAVYKGYDVSASDDLDYTDADDIRDYAFAAMQWVCGAGIFEGNGDGTVNPLGDTRRCEYATLMMRFIENIAE